MATLVGVISDTHGVLAVQALNALTGVDLIIHAGDVGKQHVLDSLARIAPILAIKGNVDVQEWAVDLPETRTVEVEAARIYMLHNLADLEFDPALRGYHAVVSGHSHKARNAIRDRVLYLNPGSAGRKRFRLPLTVALLNVSGTAVSARIVQLEKDQTRA